MRGMGLSPLDFESGAAIFWEHLRDPNRIRSLPQGCVSKVFCFSTELLKTTAELIWTLVRKDLFSLTCLWWLPERPSLSSSLSWDCCKLYAAWLLDCTSQAIFRLVTWCPNLWSMFLTYVLIRVYEFKCRYICLDTCIAVNERSMIQHVCLQYIMVTWCFTVIQKCPIVLFQMSDYALFKVNSG